MRSKTFALALIIGTSGLATAQPAPPAPPPPPEETGNGVVEPTPMPTPQIVVEQPPAPKESAERPTAFSIAIGAGYAFPTALNMPNTTSVRLRLMSGLTLEPIVTLGKTDTTTDNGMVKTTTAQSEFQVAALARLPMVSRGHADLELLGSLGLNSQKTDPDGDNNNTTTTTLSVGWGIAVGYWISSHWQLSLSATNPLLAYTSQKREMVPPLLETTNSSSTLGVIFDPHVTLMIHLYN
jgi:hypothetical protein